MLKVTATYIQTKCGVIHKINTLYKEIAQTYNYIKIKRLVSRQAYL